FFFSSRRRHASFSRDWSSDVCLPISPPVGERIVAMANRVLEQTATIKDIAEADKDQLQGTLALGTLSTIGPYLLPQFIPLLQQRARQLSLYIEEAEQPALALKLRNGDLDAIVTTAPYAEAEIVTQPLFDEPLVLVLPAHHRLAQKPLVAASDLDPGEVLLLGEGHAFREEVLRAFPHLTPRDSPQQGATHAFRGSTLETLRHMVA